MQPLQVDHVFVYILGLRMVDVGWGGHSQAVDILFLSSQIFIVKTVFKLK